MVKNNSITIGFMGIIVLQCGNLLFSTRRSPIFNKHRNNVSASKKGKVRDSKKMRLIECIAIHLKRRRNIWNIKSNF